MTTTTNRQAIRSQTARDNIVQAALTVFALKGYAATSMDDVCMAAGCSKGGLYHHFRTKNAVLRGVAGRLAQARALIPPFPAGDGMVGVAIFSLVVSVACGACAWLVRDRQMSSAIG